MNTAEFRNHGKEMVDYICNYMETLPTRRVTADVAPGYLRELIPSEAPQKPEDWKDVMEDLDRVIMPGITHWQHPQFHAYFPSGNSYPSILGDMLGDAIGAIGFSWVASPACTELETITMDWVGKALGLPGDFLSDTENSKGGGVIQGSASECILVSLLAARAKKLEELKKHHPFVDEGVLLSRLVAYCSKESHSCVEKAAMIGFVKLRTLQPDNKFSLRGASLKEAIRQDKAMGLIPFFLSCTLGTTSCCSFDKLEEMGPVCEENNMWMHVDCAYGGAGFLCPENRYLMKGIEHAMTVNMNPNKWMLVNFDCSILWVKDRVQLTKGMVVDPLYLQHDYSEAIDYRHWGIALSRRFRALKIWFVMRSYGIEGLQNYIRTHSRLAKVFEQLVLADPRFEICNEVLFGLVCFRLRAQSNGTNAKLLSTLNATGKIHLIPASLDDKYIIRFSICAENCQEKDVEYSWKIIQDTATKILKELNADETEAIQPLKRPLRMNSIFFNPLTRTRSQSTIVPEGVRLRTKDISKARISRSSLDLVALEGISGEELGLLSISEPIHEESD